MSYSLNADQLAIQDLVRRVAQDKVAARADAIDRSAEYPHDMFDLLKELGLFALPFPEKYGGTGSLLGALVGSFVVGILYNFGPAMVPELAYVVLFLPMLLVLVLRPQGLFGRQSL